MKTKSLFSCSDCSYKTVKWMGCCPECNQWNTLQEVKPALPEKTFRTAHKIEMTSLENVKTEHVSRMLSGISEWDRVVGGGLMAHSLNVLTGDPGIGKSTLLLQISNQLAQNNNVFYFSTEESLGQVKQRASRLGCLNKNLLFSDHTNLHDIVALVEKEKPDIVIIDSIQNAQLDSSGTIPGSIGQLRESTFMLMRLAKEQGITIILSGHVTKDGMIAGPKTLEHMVDAVFYLQGEDRWETRVLRAVKNRFGTLNELGFFQMGENGLEEVANINEHLIKELTNAPGSSLISIIEGSRPLLLELQALTIQSKLTVPQRVISGIDHKQVVLIAAILEKYLHIKLSTNDIFFKVSSGLKVKGSGSDLGVALALLSSYFQQPLPEKTIALGEITLTGHIRPINQANILINEAQKFGINQLLVAQHQKHQNSHVSVRPFQSVYELLSLFNA